MHLQVIFIFENTLTVEFSFCLDLHCLDSSKIYKFSIFITQFTYHTDKQIETKFLLNCKLQLSSRKDYPQLGVGFNLELLHLCDIILIQLRTNLARLQCGCIMHYTFYLKISTTRQFSL